MSYLELLKNKKQPRMVLQELQKPPPDFPETNTIGTAKAAISPFYSFCSSHSVHIQKNKDDKTASPIDAPLDADTGEILQADPQQESAELWVIAWTPAGTPLKVRADSLESAGWMVRMNPPPERYNDLHLLDEPASGDQQPTNDGDMGVAL